MAGVTRIAIDGPIEIFQGLLVQSLPKGIAGDLKLLVSPGLRGRLRDLDELSQGIVDSTDSRQQLTEAPLESRGQFLHIERQLLDTAGDRLHSRDMLLPQFLIGSND